MSTITLSLNGSPAPSIFVIGSTSTLSALVDGSAPLSVQWSYGLRAGPRVTGVGDIVFQPVNAETHYLHVVVVKLDGSSVEAVFILSVTVTAASVATVSITWSDPAPVAAGPNSATIHVSGAIPPRSVAWTHYANGSIFGSGGGATVALGHLQPGIHRIYATVVDADGNTVVGDSSIHVPSSFGLQSAVVPPQPIDSSLVYLGAVFSPVIEGDAATATSLPFLLTTFIGSVRLVPGSTHFSVDLDPEQSSVDDEVVVRTQLGNWTLKGPPTGLTVESLPYDYKHNQPFQPAPLDLSARYSIEAWNVHGADVSRFRFRVRFKCYAAGDAVYRYTPCEWSSYSGGLGERQRRLLAVVTQVDLSLDDESPQNRGIETFTAPNQGYIRGSFETSGRPDRPYFADDFFYSDQNVAAVYEKEDLNDIPVRVTYGMPAVRPCVLDFSQTGTPRIVNKVKRLSGKLIVYLAGGALNQGTVVTVRIHTGKLPTYEDVPVTIGQNVYNPDYSGFVKAGQANIDITDFEFNRLGLVMDFTIDESNAGTQVPSSDPMMTVGEDFYYTKINSPAIRIDTACFRDPVLMPVFEGTFLGSAVPLNSCNTLVCGPIGTYCYVELAGTGTYQALQPLGFPAPFIAPYGNEATCYKNPVFMGEYAGTAATTAHTGVIGYSGTTGCGDAYQYNPCSAAVQHQLAVVYPKLTAPHAAVSFNDQCYTLIGAIHDTRPFVGATAADVSPVTGCTDIVCTGSNPNGGSVDYIDRETLQQVTVAFPHIDSSGIPLFGVAPETLSQGYGATPPGELHWELWHRSTFPVMTAAENTTLEFEVTPTNIWRELVVSHSGVRSHYRFYPGLTKGSISVQTGDTVTLEFPNDNTRYKGKSGQVKWYKPVPVPYAYDSVTFSMTSLFGTLTALGFCGLNNRQDYCFYGTLGTSIEMSEPNPDAVVTVKDTSSLPEMILLRTKQPHEADFRFELPYYNAERLRSPLTFKFYAGRNRVGAHGEMDVWCALSGSTFPAYLKVSNYKSLALAEYAYRKDTVQSDTSRRSLRVATEMEADALTSPRIHVDDRGRQLSVVTNELNDYVFENEIPYTFTGNFDTGISETIYRDLIPGGGPVLSNLLNAQAKPRGLCYVDSQDEVWVACPDSNTVMVLSGDGTVVTQLLSVAGAPYSTTYCADSDSVAVACMDTGSVKMFDATTRLQLTELFIPEGPFWNATAMLVSYNPVSRNVYVCGVPLSTVTLTMVEIDPRTSLTTSFLLGIPVSLSSLFYCATTMETIAATESGGSWAFNVSTAIAENLGLPLTTCRGACDVPQLARVLFSSAANPPSGRLYTYDPRSRKTIRTTFYSDPVRATGWHPLRRKYYLSTLNIFAGGPGVGVVNTNGVRLTVLNNYDWGFNWVYSPLSRLMFNTIPAFFFGSNYVGVYT